MGGGGGGGTGGAMGERGHRRGDGGEGAQEERWGWRALKNMDNFGRHTYISLQELGQVGTPDLKDVRPLEESDASLIHLQIGEQDNFSIHAHLYLTSLSLHRGEHYKELR